MNNIRKNFIFCVTILLVITMRTQAANKEGFVLDGVAAEVGGRKITIADVMREARDTITSCKLAGITPPADNLRQMYDVAASNLVAKQLILLKYKQIGKELPEWYLNQRVEKIIQDKFGGDRSKLIDMLNEHGVNYEKWRQTMVEDVIIGTMRQQFVNAKTHVRLIDIIREYNENYAQKTLDGLTRVSMILMPKRDKTANEIVADANRLVNELRKGQDFAQTARQISIDPHADDGGDWGYINPQEQLRKELVDALVTLKIGEISNPVAIQDDLVYIIKKTDEREDLKIPFELVQEKIENALYKHAAAKRYQAWLRTLADEYDVRIYPLP